jgi:hypothetical protein
MAFRKIVESGLGFIDTLSIHLRTPPFVCRDGKEMNMNRTLSYNRVNSFFDELTGLPSLKTSEKGSVLEVEMVIPTPEQIRLECQRVQAGWDERETLIRMLRAEMACKFGVCRND